MIFNKNRWEKFPAETVALLFTAVDEDDMVNDDTRLPNAIEVQCTDDTLRRNFALCLQLWEEGFTRSELLGLINRVMKDTELSAAQKKQYKYIRARYKHLRFAQRLYSHAHDSTLAFKLTTVFLGHFQDGFRNGNRGSIILYGTLLRLFLSKPVWLWVRFALQHTRLDTAKGFKAYCSNQMLKLKSTLFKQELTGTEFHNVRKIISQQVSYYDTLRSIEPDIQDAYQISRFLANINGLMGDRHDEMVADKLAGRRPYETPSVLTDNIRSPLTQLIEHFPI